jgi:adenylosuccinate lyase
MHAWKEDLNFHDLVMSDPEITSRVPREQIQRAFSIERQLRNVDKIFERVFGPENQPQMNADERR